MDRSARLSVRELQSTDLSRVRRLIVQAIDAAYSDVYPARAVLFFKEFHSRQRILERHREGEVVVLEEDGEIVATGTLLGREILGVFVSPAFQGRGYGRRVMQELEGRARANGCPSCELSVSLTSRRFYEHLGYQMTGRRSLDVGRGDRLDYWTACKALAGEESGDELREDRT